MASPALPLPQRNRLVGRIAEFGLVYFVFAVALVFFLVPFVWLFLAAFDAKAGPYIRWPERFTVDNFVYIFRELNFSTAIGNSLFIATATMLLDVVAVALAAYALSRLEIRRKDWLMYGLLLLQTMPITATMVPIYGLARTLGLRNSYLGLILVHAARAVVHDVVRIGSWHDRPDLAAALRSLVMAVLFAPLER